MRNKRESNKFWRDLVYTKGKLDEKKVMNELSDFYYIMGQVPEVYCAITGNTLSKLMYPASTVIDEFEDHNLDKEITKEDVADMLNKCDNLKELKKELVDYFELKK